MMPIASNFFEFIFNEDTSAQDISGDAKNINQFQFFSLFEYHL